MKVAKGEPIVLTADGQTFAVDPTYAVRATFVYTAPPVLINPGSPIPQTTIGYYILGADGDKIFETASFSVNPKVKTQAQIHQWNVDALAMAGMPGSGSVALYCSIAAINPCNATAGTVGVLAAAAAAIYSFLAADPIDFKLQSYRYSYQCHSSKTYRARNKLSC